MEKPFKVCSCGVQYSRDEWRALPRVGAIVDVEIEAPSPDGQEPIPPFELRICASCGSSVAKEVPYDGGDHYCRETARKAARKHGR